MKRTKKLENPSAIFTSDWHLTEKIPACRTDNFWKAQWKKVDAVSDLQKKYNCPVIHAGDLFETQNPVMSWKPSPYLLSTTIKHLPKEFWTIYGNHDLPQHSLEQKEKCGIEVLETAGVLKVLDECHWEQKPKKGLFDFTIDPNRDVLIWHVMTYKGKSPWPGCTDKSTQEILNKYCYQFDLIVTGHNHKTFVDDLDDTVRLINPGSLTRQDADQENHKPCVFLWYAKTNTTKQVFLPFEKNVISREHLDKPNARKERLRAYIENMSTDWEAALSFAKNLEKHFKENKSITKMLKDLIWQSMEK